MSEYRERRGGAVVRRGPERWQGRWTLGWEALSPGERLALVSDLSVEPLMFTPRTRTASDLIGLVEHTHEVYVASDLSTLTALDRDEAGRVEVELVTVATVAAPPTQPAS
ncbi:MAG: hypothetical protein AAGF99_02710 [Bacteroidota bacterium]